MGGPSRYRSCLVETWESEPVLSLSICTATYHTGISLAHYIYFSFISTNPNQVRVKESKNGEGYLKVYYRESNTPQARVE